MYLKKLKDLREDSDLTQKEIADILGISQRYYSNLESGNRTLSVDLLIKIANFYNVSLDELCNSKTKK